MEEFTACEKWANLTVCSDKPEIAGGATELAGPFEAEGHAALSQSTALARLFGLCGSKRTGAPSRTGLQRSATVRRKPVRDESRGGGLLVRSGSPIPTAAEPAAKGRAFR